MLKMQHAQLTMFGYVNFNYFCYNQVFYLLIYIPIRKILFSLLNFLQAVLGD